MIINYDEQFNDLICDDVPMHESDYSPDPWDGVKPHSDDGFVKNYCLPY